MSPAKERGAATVEFALVFVFFMALVIGVMEFARLMLVFSAAVEATRLGARVAVVCGPEDGAAVRARMKQTLGILEPENILISYPEPGCAPATCEPVTVRLQDARVRLYNPLVPIEVPIPSFASAVSAESRDSQNNILCD